MLTKFKLVTETSKYEKQMIISTKRKKKDITSKTPF